MMLPVYHTRVVSEWIDYNGHMGDYAYGIVFSNAATSYMDRIGIDATYRQMSGSTLYTLDSRIGFLKECHIDEELQIELALINADSKRLHIFMSMKNEHGHQMALCEQLLMHVSRSEGHPRAEEMPRQVRDKVMDDAQLSKSIEMPKWLGGRISLNKK